MADNLYEGKGVARSGDDATRAALEKKLKPWDHPKGYMAGDGLVDAVNTAIFLGQPLLLTGEPGSGKTQLAFSVAWELGLPLHVFHTKMNSTGDDLLYSYDALLHFHDANSDDAKIEPRKYVTYNALGKAIRYSREPSEWAKDSLSTDEKWKPTQSVVLVDEIDKAPRDFPNDILYETDELAFRVKQTGWEFEVNRNLLPIVIFTSNQERSLPDAFLRRCVFYHIPFPDPAQLKKIVAQRLDLSKSGGKDGSQGSKFNDAVVDRFVEIRKDDQLLKKPATAELLSWLRVLRWKGLTTEDLANRNDARVASCYPALLKTREDLERFAPKFAPSAPAA